MLNKRTTQILVASLLIAILFVLLFWWFLYNQAKSRDYQRLADMQNIYSQMLIYYSTYNTFIIDGCSSGFLIDQCFNERADFFDAVGLVDPKDYVYRVEKMSSDGYLVSFVLEVGVSGLAKGEHILNQNGL